MTPERDENNQDRRRSRRRRRKQNSGLPRLVIMLVVIVLTAVLIVTVTRRAGSQPATQPSQTAASETTAPTQATTEASGPGDETRTSASQTVIHIAAAGDLNVTDEIIGYGKTGDGYDFSHAFMEIAPVLTQADLTVLNFEGVLAGAPYGKESGSAPAELAQELADIGVDLVQTANSASIRSGVLGLQSTIGGLQNVGITSVGTFSDGEAFHRSRGFTMVEVDGVEIAVVAFTKGMDNLGLPESSQDCVNVLYEDYTTDYKKVDTDGITGVLRNVAAAEPDVTIAMVHWGSEYNENISDSQEDIAELMLDNGVDVILGTHSHLLQKIEYDENAGTLVAWSLGDFYGNAQESGSNYSVVLDLEITLDNETGLTSVTGYSTTPIYTLRPEQSADGAQRLVQLDKAIARYESNYVGRVSEEVYNELIRARDRIEDRITGDENQ